MKLFNPIFDVVRYIKMYQIYLGFRMYLIYVLGIFASFLEGIGIIMLLPLLQSLDEGNDLKNSEGIINQTIYKLINFLGLTDSILSILLLIWFTVSFLFGIVLAETLNQFYLGGFPLGFWFAHQGAIYTFVILIFVYVYLMNRLDKKFDVDET